VLSCFSDPAALISICFRSLSPGGYIELQDMVFPFIFAKPPAPDSPLKKWNDLVTEGSARVGRAWSRGFMYKTWMAQAGFQDVVEKRFYWPVGTWAKGEFAKTLGALCRVIVETALEAVSLKLLLMLGWKSDDVATFLEEVKKDLWNPDTCAYIDM
jgi:hypothetical protein